MKTARVNWKKRAEDLELQLRGWQDAGQRDRQASARALDERNNEIIKRENQLRELMQAVSLYMMSRAQLAITCGTIQASLSKGSDTPKAIL